MKLINMLTNRFERNLSNGDRITRMLLALCVPVLYFRGLIDLWAALLLGILALFILRTSLTAKCGIYYGLGLSTFKKSNENGKTIEVPEGED